MTNELSVTTSARSRENRIWVFRSTRTVKEPPVQLLDLGKRHIFPGQDSDTTQSHLYAYGLGCHTLTF